MTFRRAVAAAVGVAILAAAVFLFFFFFWVQGRPPQASSLSQPPVDGHLALALPAETANCAADVTLDGEEVALFRALNAYRASLGAGALRISGSLEAAASWKAHDLAAANYFSHTDSLGRDPFQLQADCGYTFNTWKGETLVAGCVDAACTLRQWQGSPPHDAILRDPVYAAVGLARAYDAASGLGWYWAAEFGGRQEQVPPAPCPDYNGDGLVAIQDIAAFVAPVYRLTLNGTNYDARFDRNNDGAVNSLDLLAVLPLGRVC